MVTPRVTKALNPHKRRKLSIAQIRAGFGGKRRQASLKASRKHKHKRRAAKSNPSKPKRRASAKAKNQTKPRVITKYKTRIKKVYVNPKPKRKASAKRKRRSSNPGPYLLTMSPVLGNPKTKRRKTNMAKPKRKVSAKGRSGKRNPTRRSAAAKRNNHRPRSRNPFGESTTTLVKKGFGVFIGFSASKKIPPMLGAQMNSSPMMTLLSTAITAGLITWAARKFVPGPFAEGALWGGVGGVVNMAWNTWAPAQVTAFWPGITGMGDFVPGGFPLPNGPVRYAIAPAPTQAPNGSQVNVGAFGSAW
jgi:hypothetical protein